MSVHGFKLVSGSDSWSEKVTICPTVDALGGPPPPPPWIRHWSIASCDVFQFQFQFIFTFLKWKYIITDCIQSKLQTTTIYTHIMVNIIIHGRYQHYHSMYKILSRKTWWDLYIVQITNFHGLLRSALNLRCRILVLADFRLPYDMLVVLMVDAVGH